MIVSVASITCLFVKPVVCHNSELHGQEQCWLEVDSHTLSAKVPKQEPKLL